MAKDTKKQNELKVHPASNGGDWIKHPSGKHIFVSSTGKASSFDGKKQIDK